MTDWTTQLIIKSFDSLWHALSGLIIPALFFIGLALLLKGSRGTIKSLRKTSQETRITLLIMSFNVVFIAPFIALLLTWMELIFEKGSLQLINESIWESLPAPLVILVAIFAGDLIGYWRHRLEHVKLLWPSHAVHHSDTQMTWLTLNRFHPINRLTTVAVDSAGLFLLGLPVYAIVANNIVRHYYGYFIHADLPWTYDRFGKIFVSPVMHRWHHAADPAAHNTNFATVFSLLDRWFGTFRVPGQCAVSLGVTDDMGSGVVAQLSYPFKLRAYQRLIDRFSQQTTK